MYVDNVIIRERDVWELMDHFFLVVKKLMEVGLFVTAQKVTLYAREVKWCGKLYSGTSVRYDPQRIRGLVEMRRPETVGELIQFLQAVNWMRLSLPNMVEVVSPLRALLEWKLKGTTHTKSCEVLLYAVQLNFCKQNFSVLMFSDASDLFWGSFLTQVPEEDLLSYVIRHIPGAKNYWGDLLSRLRSVCGGAAGSCEKVPVCVRSIAVVALADADYSFPSMGEIRDRQNIYTGDKGVLDSPQVWCAVKTGFIALIMGGCR